MGKGAVTETREALVLGVNTLEKQSLAEIAEDIKAHPAQLRAIFLEDSLFRDDLLYAEYKQVMVPQGESWVKSKYPTFQVLGEVDPGDPERRLIRYLIDQGAQVTANQLEAPVPNHDHKPGNQFGDGQRFSLATDQGEIHYVPHYSVGTKYSPIYQHRWKYELGDLEEALGQALALRYLDPKRVIRIKSELNGKTVYRYRSLDWYSKEEQKEIREAIEKKTQRTGDRGQLENYRFATEKDLEDKKAFKHTEDGILLRKDYRRLKKAREILEEKQSLEISFKSPSKELDHHKTERSFARSLNEVSKEYAYYLKDLLQFADGEGSVMEENKREFVAHDAPASERGVLKFRGMNPAAACEWLEQAGFLGSLKDEVDYKKIYRGSRRRGRVLPFHADYEEKNLKLKLPPGQMIIHGMTGINNDTEAVNRLSQIVETGGLKGLAERRRMGMSFKTVDPHQDTASRLDQGVPACITGAPWAGAMIYFGIDNQALKRRDLWFINQCPVGTGQMQLQAYQNYAKHIGQKRTHLPPNHKVRETHLTTGLGTYNEVYFRHEVPMQEVNTLFVAEKLVPKVEKQLKKWKQEGLVDESLQIVSFVPNPNEAYKPPFGGLPAPTSSLSLRQAIAKRASEVANRF